MMCAASATRTRQDWEQLAASVLPEGRAFINGELVGAADALFRALDAEESSHAQR